MDCENSESSSGNNINCVEFYLITPRYFRRRFRLPRLTTTGRPVGGKWNSQFEYTNWFVSILISRTQTSFLFKFLFRWRIGIIFHCSDWFRSWYAL